MATPLRFGILGLGRIAETMAAAMARTPEVVLVAVASRHGTKARDFAAARGIPHAFDGYDALLASGTVDAVYVAVPNALHAPWTIRALRAGLHVLCEKPLGVNALDAEAMAEAARASGRVLAEAFMYRHHPLYDTLLALLREEAIGRVTSVHAQFTFPCDDPHDTVVSAPLGGGALLDVGCYGVSAARLVLAAEPLRAFAFARMDGVDRTLVGLLEFPGGAIATVECSVESDERQRLEIAGTHGRILLESPWFPGEHRACLHLRVQGESRVIDTPGGDGYMLELQDLVRAVRDGSAPRVDVADALANLYAIDALTASLATGRACEVATPVRGA